MKYDRRWLASAGTEELWALCQFNEYQMKVNEPKPTSRKEGNANKFRFHEEVWITLMGELDRRTNDRFTNSFFPVKDALTTTR